MNMTRFARFDEKTGGVLLPPIVNDVVAEELRNVERHIDRLTTVLDCCDICRYQGRVGTSHEYGTDDRRGVGNFQVMVRAGRTADDNDHTPERESIAE